MASTITSRVGSTVAGGIVNSTTGAGIFTAASVAGTNTITCSTTPSITEYIVGQLYLIRPANDNTDTVTLNISSIGALPWVKPNGDAFVTGELSSLQDYLIRGTATSFITVAPF